MIKQNRKLDRLLVTGGNGFIGGEVVRQAINQGIEVVNLDALTYAASELESDLTESPLYSFARVDLRNSEEVEKIVKEFEPDTIMHLAAESHVDRSIESPREFLETNILGTANLLDAVRANKSRNRRSSLFQHISTDEVFGDLRVQDSPFDEQSPYMPSSPYSASKASSDHLVRAWARTYGMDAIITNCSNNYGPRQHHEKLIPTVIRSALAGDPICLYGTGSNIRDWIHVQDHVSGLFHVAQFGRAGETYCIGGEQELTNLAIVKLICSIFDEKYPEKYEGGHFSLVHFVQDRPGHDFRYAISNKKICSELGWSPQIDFNSGVQTTVDWYLTHE